MNAARLEEERGQAVRIRAQELPQGRKRYGNSVYAPEALYRIRQLCLARKQYTKAFDAFQTIVGRYPNTRASTRSSASNTASRAPCSTAPGRYAWGVSRLHPRAKALEYFETCSSTPPTATTRPLALMNIARGHQRMRNTEEAIDALDRMINTYPQSLLAPDAYLKLGQAHASLVEGPSTTKAPPRSHHLFRRLHDPLPERSQHLDRGQGLDEMKTILAESKITIADFYFYKRDNYTAARVFYNEAITVYPDSAHCAGRKDSAWPRSKPRPPAGRFPPAPSPARPRRRSAFSSFESPPPCGFAKLGP
jgi:outer membrane protein assembly factor BamD